MGAYRIEIVGQGPHHNRPGSDEDDSDRLAADLVLRLRAAGHNVVSATWQGLGQLDPLPAGKSVREIAYASAHAKES